MNKVKKYFPVLLIVCLSGIFLIIVSPHNLGVSPDSVFYIEAAERIAHGQSYVDVLTFWPPGYPLLLGFASKITGISVLDIGKYFNLIFFILFGITYKFLLDELRFSTLIKCFLLAILLASRSLNVSLFFWSELPCMVFITSVFLCFLKWKNTHKGSILFIGGVLSLFAFMTRYAAIGILGGLFINILFEKRTLRNKVFDLSYALFPFLTGIGVWSYYTGSKAPRDFAVHIIPFDRILDSVKTIMSWFVYGKPSKDLITSIASIIFLVLFLSIVVPIMYRHKRKLKLYIESVGANMTQILIIVLSYFFFLFLSISLFDTHTPLNYRILSLSSPFLYLLVGCLLHFLESNAPKRNVIVATLMIFFSGIAASKNYWMSHYENGAGYMSKGKKYSQYHEVINEHIIPYRGEIYTNAPDLIRLFNIKFGGNNHLNVKWLPLKISPNTKKMNDRYSDEINTMKTSVSNNNAWVVYFDVITRGYLGSKEELLNHMKNQRIIEFENGFILKASAQ